MLPLRLPPTPTPSPTLRTIRGTAARALALLLLLAPASLAFARFEWRDVVQTVEIRPDGTVEVTDERTLWTDEDFGEAFVCLPLPADVTLRLLPDSGAVSPGPDARAYTQRCEDGSGGTELVVENEERVRERRVLWHYELEGAVDVYSDVAQWYWNILESSHPPVVGYRLEARAPGPMAEPYDAYVHRYDNPEQPEVRLANDRSRLEVAFDRVPDGSGVEIRWLMDPALFTVEGEPRAALEDLLADEARIARLNDPSNPVVRPDSTRIEVRGADAVVAGTVSDEEGVVRVSAAVPDGDSAVALRVPCEGTTEFRCELTDLPVGTTSVTIVAEDPEGRQGSAHVSVRRPSRLEIVRESPWWALVPLAALAWLALRVRSAWERVGKEPDVPEMQYAFEPPSDLPPAEALAMMQQNFQSSSMSRGFHATVMDLARRGYGEFTGKKGRFEMRLFPDRDPAGLEPFERDVLDYLEAAARSDRRGDPHHLKFSELKRYSQKKFSRFLPRWAGDVRDRVEARFGGGPLVTEESKAVAGRYGLQTLLAGIGLFAAGMMLLDGAAQTAFVIGGVLAVVLAIVAFVTLPSWRPEVAREVAGWRSFRRTLTDYTRMKDAPNDFFELWDRYFVYAAAFGVAQRFLREIGRAVRESGRDEAALASRGAWLGSSSGRGLAGFSSFADASSAATAMSSALASSGASASSGGSSSGGGGGGAAGGSSGGR